MRRRLACSFEGSKRVHGLGGRRARKAAKNAAAASTSHHADFFLHHIDRLQSIVEELGKQTNSVLQQGLQ